MFGNFFSKGNAGTLFIGGEIILVALILFCVAVLYVMIDVAVERSGEEVLAGVEVMLDQRLGAPHVASLPGVILDEAGVESVLAEDGFPEVQESGLDASSGAAAVVDPDASAFLVAGDNICRRTPEIQRALISSVGIASCRSITGEELLGIRVINSPDLGLVLQPGDLYGLHNLQELTLDLDGEIPEGSFDELVSLEFLSLTLAFLPQEGVFDSLGSLESFSLFLDLGSDDWAPDGLFDSLSSLRKLNISVEPSAGDFFLTADSFTGLENLEVLYLSHVAEVSADSLVPLVGLKQIRMSGVSADFGSQPYLPPSVLKGLPALSGFEFSRLLWRNNTTVALHSHEVVCRLDDGISSFDVPVTVDGELVSFLGLETINGQQFCTLGLGLKTSSMSSYPEEVVIEIDDPS